MKYEYRVIQFGDSMIEDALNREAERHWEPTHINSFYFHGMGVRYYVVLRREAGPLNIRVDENGKRI